MYWWGHWVGLGCTGWVVSYTGGLGGPYWAILGIEGWGILGVWEGHESYWVAGGGVTLGFTGGPWALVVIQGGWHWDAGEGYWALLGGPEELCPSPMSPSLPPPPPQDGHELPPPIAFDVEAPSTLPPCKVGRGW